MVWVEKPIFMSALPADYPACLVGHHMYFLFRQLVRDEPWYKFYVHFDD